MSFSFTVAAAHKEAAKRAVMRKLADVVVAQPCHAVDAALIARTAYGHIDLLSEANAAQDVIVVVNGSIGGDMDHGTGTVNTVTSTGEGVTAYLATKSMPGA